MNLDDLRKSKAGQLPENAHLFAVGGVEAKKPKSNQRSEGQNSQLESRPPSLGYRVTLVQCRRRMLDSHDNMRTAVKPLVDAITETLGFKSDDDPRLKWEYGQCETRGSEGVIVRVEEL